MGIASFAIRIGNSERLYGASATEAKELRESYGQGTLRLVPFERPAQPLPIVHAEHGQPIDEPKDQSMELLTEPEKTFLQTQALRDSNK